MVRTKANTGSGVRVVAEKATRKNFGGSSSRIDLGSPSSKKDKYAGGNPVCQRPTPNWQKPIDKFFTQNTSQNTKTSETPEKSVSSEEKENVSPSKTNGAASKRKSDSEAGSSNAKSPANGAVVNVSDEISED